MWAGSPWRGSIWGGSVWGVEAQISALFAAGEQGAWYDPSDLSTLFQDFAGTTPVTALGQPVGLMLDKRLGLVRGPELVTNGGFDNDLSGWDATVGAGDSIEWVGGAVHITMTGSVTTSLSQDILTAGRWYEIEFDVLPGSSGRLKLGLVGVNGEHKVDMTPGHKRFILSQLLGSVFEFRRIVGETANAYIDNISVRELPGNHASQPTATARPTLQADASGRKYLQFDGVDDFLVTSAIDFTGADKMTVLTGVRKLSDAAAASVIEFSTASAHDTPGSFAVYAPPSATATYSVRSAGSAFAHAVSGELFPAPRSDVLVAQMDIPGDSISLRVNGVVAASSSADQGAGNYGNYPLYIGRRGGTSLPFNGNFYSLLVRGALSTQAQIEAAERYANMRTGAY